MYKIRKSRNGIVNSYFNFPPKLLKSVNIPIIRVIKPTTNYTQTNTVHDNDVNSIQQNHTIQHKPIRTAFHDTKSNYVVTGTSVRGSSHVSSNDPCQDYSAFESINEKWAIAVTSDGAGSCKQSNKGSKANCIKAIKLFKQTILNNKWINDNYIPSDIEWQLEATKVYDKIYNDANTYAKNNNFQIQELSATIIVNIITPYGILVSHIGDGRAGYLNKDDKWIATITPHKGEEANQTVFLHSNAHSKINFKMSNTYVPECKVIVDEVKAFTLMSDGCEKSTWLCSTFIDEKFEDPNKPYEPFFNNIINYLKTSKAPQQDLAELLIGGTNAFKKESDDKTIIIGYKK